MRTMTQTSIRTNGAQDSDRVLDALARIERRLARVEATLDEVSLLKDRAPALLAMITDTLDQKIAQGRESGIDMDERLRVILHVAERLTTPAALRMAESLVDNLPALEGFLSSGVLAAGPVEVVSKAGAALADVELARPRPVGAWGAFRAMGDPDIQRALGFALAFARIFGKSLEPSVEGPALLPASPEEER
jgi:uncharacterized protein YjgD (DUF1641 family)